MAEVRRDDEEVRRVVQVPTQYPPCERRDLGHRKKTAHDLCSSPSPPGQRRWQQAAGGGTGSAPYCASLSVDSDPTMIGTIFTSSRSAKMRRTYGISISMLCSASSTSIVITSNIPVERSSSYTAAERGSRGEAAGVGGARTSLELGCGWGGTVASEWFVTTAHFAGQLGGSRGAFRTPSLRRWRSASCTSGARGPGRTRAFCEEKREGWRTSTGTRGCHGQPGGFESAARQLGLPTCSSCRCT